MPAKNGKQITCQVTALEAQMLDANAAKLGITRAEAMRRALRAGLSGQSKWIESCDSPAFRFGAKLWMMFERDEELRQEILDELNVMSGGHDEQPATV